MDLTIVVGGADEAATARKTCRKCRTEQTIDQFYDARGNGRIVVNCLGCRNKQKHHVAILGYHFFLLTYRRLMRHEQAFRLLARSPAENVVPLLSHLRLRLHLSHNLSCLYLGLEGTSHTASLRRCITKGGALLQIARKWQSPGIDD